MTNELLYSPEKQDYMGNKWKIAVIKSLTDGEFLSCFIYLSEFVKKLDKDTEQLNLFHQLRCFFFQIKSQS